MEINISANTLFHFTSKKESLINILRSGLYVRYSLENFENLIAYENAEIVFPMTCFCDIPLSQIKKHVTKYGKYAIGLTKDWGMQNKVSPVIYSYPGSVTAEILNEITDKLENFFDIKEEEKPKRKALKKSENSKLDLSNLLKNYNSPLRKYEGEVAGKILELHYKLSDFIRYIKPYEGKFFRGSGYFPNDIRFYDEREWRFTPSKSFFDDINIKNSYKAEYYKNEVKRRAINIKLASKLKLTFSPKDIRFIILHSDREIPSMLKTLDEIFGSSASQNDLKILGTRIISLEQILEDL